MRINSNDTSYKNSQSFGTALWEKVAQDPASQKLFSEIRQKVATIGIDANITVKNLKSDLFEYQISPTNPSFPVAKNSIDCIGSLTDFKIKKDPTDKIPFGDKIVNELEKMKNIFAASSKN